jgi:hypothetical protein
MAIVSISRIQHRRGRKLEGAGMPQLASGELGWAIDTQELYIGNGSVSEGAPTVGNTRVLTEHDNILDFAVNYSFRDGAIQTGDLFSTPVYRTLQERLDERVTLAEFGATGDGSDQTLSLQRALDQLYLNPTTKSEASSRIVLYIPAGEYLLTDTIYVPPFTTIIGAGKGKTVLISETDTVFKTVNGDSDPGDYANDFTSTIFNQPRDIIITGLTIQSSSTQPAIVLSSCVDSLFQDISLVGSWESGDDNAEQIGIRLDGISTPISSNNNRFINVDIYGFNYAIRSDYDTYYNIFSNSTFKNCRYGIVFGEFATGGVGQQNGPSYNTIQTCLFDQIDQNAIWVEMGDYNTSKANKFLNVGNDGGSPATAVASTIKFTTHTNVSEGDFFARSMSLLLAAESDPYPLTKSVPDVEGRVTYTNLYKNSLAIGYRTSFTDMLKLPLIDSGKITIDYIYTDVNLMKEGKLEIVSNTDNSSYTINDDYNWIGDSAYSTLLEFEVQPADYDNDGNNETLVIRAKNTIPVLTNDTFLYTITVKS